MDYKLYLRDKGIYKSKDHYFYSDKKQVTDVLTIERLNNLRVPPAWRNVWYASNEKCHIQVHGLDNAGKKQYILSQRWTQKARYKKYVRMKEFMKDISRFKRKIKLNFNGVINIDKTTLTKLLFNLLMDLHIRIGNEKYASQNKSYGLTTLRQKHCLKKESYYLNFDGKSKIHHSIEVPKKYNIYFKILKVDNSDDLLFSNQINSETLNDFLKKNMGEKYTCKDFRTYSANVLYIKAFLKNSKKQGNVKKIVLQSIDESAKKLGHSRSIARKSYISESLVDYCLESFDVASSEDSETLLLRV